MNKKGRIKEVLRKYAKNKINLSSERAREIVATKILEVIEEGP